MSDSKGWTEGRKDDSGKLRYDLVPVDAHREFVRVLTEGARKYEDRNWEKGINYSRCYAAAQRHMNSWFEGNSIDPEFGINHLAHAICCLNFLLAYELRGMEEFDDRPSTTV